MRYWSANTYYLLKCRMYIVHTHIHMPSSIAKSGIALYLPKMNRYMVLTVRCTRHLRMRMSRSESETGGCEMCNFRFSVTKNKTINLIISFWANMFCSCRADISGIFWSFYSFAEFVKCVTAYGVELFENEFTVATVQHTHTAHTWMHMNA